MGVNLLPINKKICNFDCIYCECGLSDDKQDELGELPLHNEVFEQLDFNLRKLRSENREVDAITFAGNGEPTLHPHFNEIMYDTVFLRNKYFPEAKIAVLSNATTLNRPAVLQGMQQTDICMLKLDAGTEKTFRAINQPRSNQSLQIIGERLRDYEGEMIIQSMFTRGSHEGEFIDNTQPEELEEWISLLQSIAPKQVVLYSIDRNTPVKGLQKISSEKLAQIAAKVEAIGIPATVA